MSRPPVVKVIAGGYLELEMRGGVLVNPSRSDYLESWSALQARVPWDGPMHLSCVDMDARLARLAADPEPLPGYPDIGGEG